MIQHRSIDLALLLTALPDGPDYHFLGLCLRHDEAALLVWCAGAMSERIWYRLVTLHRRLAIGETLSSNGLNVLFVALLH